MHCSKGLSSRISDAAYIDSKILDITDFWTSHEICVDDSSAHSFRDERPFQVILNAAKCQ